MKQNIAAQAGVEPANVWALKIVKNTPKPILFTSYQRKPALKNQINEYKSNETINPCFGGRIRTCKA